MRCHLPSWYQVLVTACLGITGIRCALNDTECHYAGSGASELPSAIQITSGQCDQVATVTEDQPLDVSFTLTDIDMSAECSLHISTMYSRREKICIGIIDANKLDYVNCSIMFDAIDVEPSNYEYSSSTSIVMLCIYGRFCFSDVSQVTLTFRRTMYHEDKSGIGINLQVTSYRYTIKPDPVRTPKPTTIDHRGDKNDYSSNYAETAEDFRDALKKPWFYLIFVSAAGLLICGCIVYKSGLRTRSVRTITETIEAPYQADCLDQSAPPDYNSLYAPHQTSAATSSLLNNTNVVSGMGALFGTDGTGNSQPENTDSCLNNDQSKYFEGKHADVDCRDDNVGRDAWGVTAVSPYYVPDVNIGGSSILPPPPSYEDAMKL